MRVHVFYFAFVSFTFFTAFYNNPRSATAESFLLFIAVPRVLRTGFTLSPPLQAQTYFAAFFALPRTAFSTELRQVMLTGYWRSTGLSMS